jgi:hypothetical protein
VNVDGSRDRRRVISPDAVEQLVSREQDAPMLDEVLEQEKSPRNLALDEQICQIEREVLRQVRPDPTWKLLKTVWGIGPILAANFSIRHYEVARRYYQRKVSKTNTILARKALAHKLARASFFVMRDQTRFVPERLFG